MDNWNDIIVPAILGIVEGLTEFLPVSSTGHLILVGHLLGFSGARAATFDIFIQLGAIAAVMTLYFQRFLALLDFTARDSQDSMRGIAGIKRIIAGCVPAFILGALLHSFIKAQLFSTTTVAIGFLVGAVIFIWLERKVASGSIVSTTNEISTLTMKQAVCIGLFQTLALWPGMSRSGSCIVGAMLAGRSRRVAAEFSFIIALPVLCAAAVLDLYKSYSILTQTDALPFAIGFVTAWISAYMAVKVFINFISRNTLVPFAWYRIAVALLIFWLL